MTTISTLWRRLDGPGHDACHLVAIADGWLLEGRAAFSHDGAPAHVAYQVACDGAWRSLGGQVVGWLGDRSVEMTVARTGPGVWELDDELVSDLADCTDLDFSITPATNLLQLRRIALEVGQAADVPVAWLDVASRSLRRLTQRYERLSATTYRYEAPTVGYEGVLEVAPEGFIRHYPGLWQEEP